MKLKESEKFMILRDMAEQFIKTRVTLGDRLDGFYDGKKDRIDVIITRKMEESDWSQISALLIHEVGHFFNFVEVYGKGTLPFSFDTERNAWSVGEKWVNKIHYLRPKLFEKCRDACLNEYQQCLKTKRGKKLGIKY